jgi:hypothetical protein
MQWRMEVGVWMYRVCKGRYVANGTQSQSDQLIKNDRTITQSLSQDTLTSWALPTIFNSPTMNTPAKQAAAADKITVFAEVAGERARRDEKSKLEQASANVNLQIEKGK